MFEPFRRLFAKPATPAEAAPPIQSTLYADSALYRPTDFPRYNPDDLIGRKGWQIYAKMMQDEQIKAAVKFRRNAVTGRDWAFTFTQDVIEQIGEDEAERRLAVLNQAVRRMPGAFKRSLNFIMKAMYQGFSVTEKVHEPFEWNGSIWWGIKSLKPKPFESFYPVVDEYGDLIYLEQAIGGKRQKVELSSVIWYIINPEVDEYYGQSELREAYRDWYSKDVLTKLENIYLERMAGGLVWAEADKDAPRLSTTDAASLQSVLSNIQTKTGIQMPTGWQLKVNNPNSTTAFSDAIERHDRNMAKALLLPNLMGLTESGQTGSYGQSQTQLEAFVWMLDSDAADLAEVLDEQLFHQLCDYNWGDGLYPEFYFKPLSKSQLYIVLDAWNKLIQSGAVEASDTDEAYLRELMGFPEKGEPRAKPQPPMLPGMQPLPPPDDEEEDEPPPDDGGDGEPPEDDDEDEDMTADGKGCGHDHDHTFFPESGMMQISYGKFARIQKRVDFAAIERNATIAEWQAAEAMGETMGRLAAYLAEQVNTNPALMTDPNELLKVKVPADITAELRKESRSTLADGWELGVNNAKREVEKAGATRMSKAEFARFASVGDIAAKYFNAKSFQMAGNLTDEAMALFKNIILNGIKYSKSTDEVVRDIYTQFAQKGMMTEDQIVDALGQALDIENPTYRLQTVIKTNSFEAINEGRFSFFTDPAMGGFVTGLMYSAILDSRTTDICAALDDRAWAADSSVWEKYRPPNHYNCRSLLVAVTQGDTDVTLETQPPAVQPQEGFK